ncbi:cellulase family glycosylhydrolase [Actinoplanes sp. NPDC049118]|uniref:cellulase family glycosylhydrolase n=1 Tax=Actinoplanes sp. NPDC049118 TaxID=3155769 RepID=UPI0033F79175
MPDRHNDRSPGAGRRKPRRLLLAGALTLAGLATPPALLVFAQPGSAQVVPTGAAGLDAADIIDGFGGAVGSAAPGWTVAGDGGTATVQDVPDTIDRGLRLTDTSAAQSTTVSRSLGSTSAPVVAGVRLRAGQTTSVVGLHLDSPAGHAATVGLGSGGRLYAYDGAKQVTIGAYQANEWLDLRIATQPGTKTYSVFLRGSRLAKDLAFRAEAKTLTAVQVGVSKETTGTAWIDDVRIFAAPIGTDWTQIGTVTPRTAKQIGSSRLISGVETTGRNYAKFSEYQRQLAALGTTTWRVMPEWNDVEQNTEGRYNWAKTEEIINAAVAAGAKPWVQFSYGSWYYTTKKGLTAGGANLGAGLPAGEGLDKAENWCNALVEEFKDRVSQYEIWNEPNNDGAPTTIAKDYATYYKRMAQCVRAQQPKAVIYATEFGISVDFADKFMTELKNLKDAGEADNDTAKQAARIALVDGFAYHPYDNYPDNPKLYNTMAELRKTLAKYSPSIVIRQGENNAPSTAGTFGAFSADTFTERSQIAYNLRRNIGDIGVGIDSSNLGTCDLWYKFNATDTPKINSKGVVACGPDLKATYTKLAYYGLQNTAALFDSTLEPLTRLEPVANWRTESPIKGFAYSTAGNGDRKVTVRAFEKTGSAEQAVALWFGGDPAQQPEKDSQGNQIAKPDRAPNEDRSTKPVDVTFPASKMSNPVLIDLVSGNVYQVPATAVQRSGGSLTLKGVPIGNTPVVVADRSLAGL